MTLDHRQQLAAEIRVWWQVLDYLPLEELVLLRSWLRQPSQVEPTVGYPLVAQARTDLLNRTARRLVDDCGWPADYLVSTGDLVPNDADDLTALVPPDIGGLDDLS